MPAKKIFFRVEDILKMMEKERFRVFYEETFVGYLEERNPTKKEILERLKYLLGVR